MQISCVIIAKIGNQKAIRSGVEKPPPRNSFQLQTCVRIFSLVAFGTWEIFHAYE